ncbi:MAG: TetR/AcrR family transcriptional regulator [Mucilaginibacter sp.]
MDKDKIDKKDHILDVAERVFSDLGYDAASTRFISGEAGVNMAMLNYYFGSKDGLFLAVIERKIEMFHSLIQSIGNDDSMSALDKLEKGIDSFINKITVNNCFIKIVNREIMGNRGELTEKIGSMMIINALEFKKILQEGIDSGEFRKDVETEMVIATIFGTKNYITGVPHVASKLLGKDVNDEKFMEEELKPRIKTYLKQLLKFYLLK